MVRIIMAVFALACILMIAGYELEAPRIALAGIVLWSIILIICWNIGSKLFRRN